MKQQRLSVRDNNERTVMMESEPCGISLDPLACLRDDKPVHFFCLFVFPDRATRKEEKKNEFTIIEVQHSSMGDQSAGPRAGSATTRYWVSRTLYYHRQHLYRHYN